MRKGSLSGALLLVGALIPLTSCSSSPGLTSIVVTPNVMNFGGAGLTTQLTAVGHYTRPNHADITKDITSQVNWASATPDCVTVNSTGLITAGQNICSGILISASTQGFHGIIIGTMTVNVTQPNATATNVALLIVSPQTPAPQTVGAQLTFTAKGYDAAGNPLSLVNPVTWTSSNTAVATIVANTTSTNPATANATMVSSGTATISAGYTNTDGTPATSPTPVTLTVQ
jgi:hypothetical protein